MKTVRSRQTVVWVLATLLTVVAIHARSASAMPAGFVSEKVKDFDFLVTDMAFAPDGRLFLLDKGGSVRVMDDDVLAPTPFVTLKVTDNRERGLLGLAFDPAFATNRRLFLYYTTGPGSKDYGGAPKNRLSSFLADANDPNIVEAGSEHVLLDNIASDAGFHNGGALAFGADGKLYIATGDGGKYPDNAQDLASLNGKILRLNASGSVPKDNPYVGRTKRRPEIWASGLRNPWRITFHPTSGKLLIADVGSSKFEEVNIGKKGANYGWPLVEGVPATPVAGLTDPLYAYARASKNSSIIGGIVYAGTQFPERYRGTYFFGDFGQGFLKFISFTAGMKVARVERFDNDLGWMIGMVESPDGSLYLSVGDSAYSGHIQKISYTGAAETAERVTAKVTASRGNGSLPLTVRFRAKGSDGGAAAITGYAWEFGDGATTTGKSAQHVFRTRGRFTVRLTVTNANGESATATTVVQAGNTKPKAVIEAPTEGKTFTNGARIAFTGTATDAEDGALPAKRFRWEVVLTHRTHTHPYAGPYKKVKRGSFVATIDDVHADEEDIAIRIELTVTDSGGLSTTVTRTIRRR